MTDVSCTKWVLPAISLGYAVVNDPCGKLRFWNNRADIRCINGVWRVRLTSDGRDEWRIYDSLKEALENESIG